VNCQAFRKFLYAFTDGELETNENLHALEHLNMCPACCAKVDAQEQLKARLEQHFVQERASDLLRQGVLSAIQNEVGEPPPAAPSRNIMWLFGPMALAASIALAFVGVRWMNQPADPSNPTVAETPSEPVLGTVTVAQVEGKLIGCGVMQDAHHAKSLPRDLTSMRAAMEKKVGHKVLAPDLTADGYVLQAGCYCGLPANPGANVIYRDKNGAHLLGIFSVKRIEALLGPKGKNPLGENKGYRVCGGCTNSIVSFDEGDVTFVLCAPIEKGRLLELAEPLRLAVESARNNADWTIARR
jgi:anti-sigma factor RsiW